MSKEMMIVFVYDTEKCQNEADDPVSAVLYFHPSWVSDVQKLALCGQLMGVSHFLQLNFFPPQIISLQNGKFIIKDFGRFLLAIGTDRNISESILEHRADLLTSLVKLYHRDIQNVYDQCTVTGQYKNVSEKLYHIFETYLPVLQYNGSIFQNVPTMRLPKSASNIFLDAMQTLQSCQQTKGVLGGVILYHNKIIATQLSPSLSKRLVLTDPYRIKSTAENISVHFHVPVGVQLIVVYIPIKEYIKLKQDSVRAQTAFNNNTNTTVLPFQLKRKMKRDKSLIFTHIPEEEAVGSLSNNNNEGKNVSDMKPFSKTRPTHLPLRFKNVTTKDIPESGFSSINFDESDSFPQFIGKTSVCSTPLAENKILHGNILSICANQIDELADKKTEIENKPKKLKDEINFLTFMSNPPSTLKKITRRLSLRSFNFGLSSFGKKSIKREYEDDSDDEVQANGRFQTITDPTYPIFNSDGIPISKYLYDQYIDEQLEGETEIGIDASQEAESIKIDGFDYDTEMKISPKTENFNVDIITVCEEKKANESNNDEIAKPQQSSSTTMTIETKRKSLTLPLKSLTLDLDGNETTKEIPKDSISTRNILDSPTRQRKLSGIALTPLMSKLTILAMNDERSSGFSSWDTTPGYDVPGMTPIDSNKSFVRRRSSVPKIEEIVENEEDGTSQKVELFICGQQNMTMLLLVEENSIQKQEIVQQMWETCISRFTKIETNLHQILNINVDGADKNDGDYSFICLDPKWDIVHRGGPWSPEELIILEEMHTDFKENPEFTESIIRCDESVLYGYQCGDMQIFYKQPAHQHKGLPPPADAMGNVPLTAKRRLERDHSIILL